MNSETNSPAPSPSVRELATDALRYWEPRRIVYNAVLALIVLGDFFAAWPNSKSALTFDAICGLFLLAVLANVAYCAAYVVDLFVQLSGFRPAWNRLRRCLLVLGITFAAILTRFFALCFFHHTP